MTKRYVSKYRKMMIGPDIKFQDGVFETDDPKLQALIESNNAFGISLHVAPAREIEAERKVRAEVREKQEAEANAEARERVKVPRNNRSEAGAVEPERTRFPYTNY